MYEFDSPMAKLLENVGWRELGNWPATGARARHELAINKFLSRQQSTSRQVPARSRKELSSTRTLERSFNVVTDLVKV